MGVDSPDRQPFEPIGGLDPVDRLMDATGRRQRHVEGFQGPPPTLAQVGMVLRALADHTANRASVVFNPDPSWRDPADQVASSVGRWFHRYADAVEHRVHGWTKGKYLPGDRAGDPGGNPDVDRSVMPSYADLLEQAHATICLLLEHAGGEITLQQRDLDSAPARRYGMVRVLHQDGTVTLAAHRGA